MDLNTIDFSCWYASTSPETSSLPSQIHPSPTTHPRLNSSPAFFEPIIRWHVVPSRHPSISSSNVCWKRTVTLRWSGSSPRTYTAIGRPQRRTVDIPWRRIPSMFSSRMWPVELRETGSTQTWTGSIGPVEDPFFLPSYSSLFRDIPLFLFLPYKISPIDQPKGTNRRKGKEMGARERPLRNLIHLSYFFGISRRVS